MSSRSAKALAFLLSAAVGSFALSGPEAPGAPELGMGIETWRDGWSLLAGSGITPAASPSCLSMWTLTMPWGKSRRVYSTA